MRLSEALQSTLDLRWSNTKDEAGSYARAERVIHVLGNLQVRQVRPLHGNKLRTALRSAGLAAGTINRHLSALRAMLATAHEEGALDSLPTFRAEREPEGRTRVFTPSELAELIEALPPQYRPLVAFLAETGLRVGEALRLTWSDVSTDRVQVRHTKGGRPRAVPLTLRALEALEAAGRTGDGPFRPMSQSSFGHAWNRARESLPWARGDAEVVPHALRHTCASRLVRAGVGLLVVRDWLGHSTVKTTERYAHLAGDALDGAAAALEMS